MLAIVPWIVPARRHTAFDSTFIASHGRQRDLAQLQPFEQSLRRAAKALLTSRPELKEPSRKRELERLVDDKGRLILPPGGLEHMEDYHFVLVRGGAWRTGDELW